MLEHIDRFGVCPRCGRSGLEDDERSTGYKLELFRGKYMCSFCIAEIEDSEYDQASNALYDKDQQLRDSMGVTR